MQRDNFAYLSIIRWPSGYALDDCVEAIVEATGLDPVNTKQRVIKGAPAIIHRFDASMTQEIMAPLKARRIAAFCFTERAMRTLPDPLLAKRLAAAEGAADPMYLCDIWRGESTGFRAADLFLIVRGRLKKVHRETQSESSVQVGYIPGVGMTMAPVTETMRYDRTNVSDMMDLYLRDGRRIRVNGDKFNFDILGKDRGFTDNENMDKLALLLGSQALNCRIDTDFENFSCPMMLVRGWRSSPAERGETRNDSPAFDLYSVWVYLLYKAMAAREK